MRDQLSRDEVHVVLKALEDLYVQQGGHPDLNITLDRDGEEGLERVTGFVDTIGDDDVTLGQYPGNQRVTVPLTGVVRICVER
jgi:hypothetical protein